MGITDPHMLPSRSRFGEVEITSIGPVRNAASLPAGSGPDPHLHDLGDSGGGRPRDIHLTYSQHHCARCRRYFPADLSDLAAPRPSILIGSRLWPFGSWSRTAYPMRPPVGISGAIIGSSSPTPPSRTGWRPGGRRPADPGRLPRLGPRRLLRVHRRRMSCTTAPTASCRSSITGLQALCYAVLDHDPAHEDIRPFFRRFQAALASRGLTLRGITTDGSELYPRPISEVFGAVEHQVCRFHILAELNKAVLRAVAQVRSIWPRRSRSSRAGGPALRRRSGRPGDAGTWSGRSATCLSIVISS